MYTLTKTDSIIRDSDGACIPADPRNVDYQQYLEDVKNGATVTPYVAPPPTEADYSAAIQAHIYAVAKARGYDDAVSCASYATSANAQWAAEAKALIAWRDSVWAYAYNELAKVQSGQRTTPTVDGFVAELPVITWP